MFYLLCFILVISLIPILLIILSNGGNSEDMEYSITLDDKEAIVKFSDNLTSDDLTLVQEMLIKAIENRKNEIKRKESNELSLSDSIDRIYPPLSCRTLNVLKRGGKTTIGDVLDCTPSELMKLRNMGKKSLEEIQVRFSKYGNFKGTTLMNLTRGDEGSEDCEVYGEDC